MEILRTNEEELAVRFDQNPAATESDEWLDRFRSALTGAEKRLRVDLTALPIVTSLGVNVVVGMYQRLDRQGGTVRVAVSSEKTRHVFELFQLTTLFDVDIVAP